MELCAVNQIKNENTEIHPYCPHLSVNCGFVKSTSPPSLDVNIFNCKDSYRMELRLLERVACQKNVFFFHRYASVPAVLCEPDRPSGLCSVCGWAGPGSSPDKVLKILVSRNC